MTSGSTEASKTASFRRSVTFKLPTKSHNKINILETERFIHKNFRIRKCQRYVKVQLDSEPLTRGEKRCFNENDCVCGKPFEWHVENRGNLAKKDADSNKPWSQSDDTAQFPCDTFGQLLFRPGDGVDSSEILPGSSAKYLRLDGQIHESDYLEHVYELMTSEKYWGMKKPGLLMEITGSTSDFAYIDKLTIDKFHEGLLKAARSSNAWIVTNGMKRGVVGLIGEAVAKTRMTHADGITCLGIASWGNVKYKESLVQRQGLSSRPKAPLRRSVQRDPNARGLLSLFRQQPVAVQRGKWAVDYYIDSHKLVAGMKTGVPLEPNHNFYLLVDNGRDKRNCEEVSFRARLMEHISKKKLPGSGTVVSDPNAESWTPSLLMVVGGGEGTLKTVEETLSLASNKNRPKSARPVIVVPGFGGTADLIAFAYEITQEKSKEVIEEEQKAKMMQKTVSVRRTMFTKSPAAAGAKAKEEERPQREHETSESLFPQDFNAQILKHPEMEFLLSVTSENDRQKKAERYVRIIRECLKVRKMISVLDIASESTERKDQLDFDLLNAIFKAKLGGPTVMLELAQIWNRADFAKEILTESAELIKAKMNCNEAMIRAISNGQDKICKLFEDYNLVDTKKFVTRSVMGKIYYRVFVKKNCKVSKSCVALFRHFLFERMGEADKEIPREMFLKIIGEILAQKVECYVDNLFTEEIMPIIGQSNLRDGGEDEVVEREIARSILPALEFAMPGAAPPRVPNSPKTVTPKATTPEEEIDDMEIPYLSGMRDLFLFALLIDCEDMAISFWVNGRDHLGTALFAAKFLSRLSTDANQTGLVDLALQYNDRACKWQKRARDVLTLCYDDHPERTNRLLTRSLLTWQNYSVLEIAYHASQQEFMEHPAVQIKLNQLWYGRIAPFARVPIVYLSVVCWPLVYKLKFLTEADEEHNVELEEEEANNPADGEAAEQTATEFDEADDQKDDPEPEMRKRYVGVRSCFRRRDRGKIAFPTALYYLFSCPQVKFFIHSIALVISLLFFSYFIISGVEPHIITILEGYIWIWAAVSLIGRVRESFGEEILNHFDEKLKHFFSQSWNWVDVFGSLFLLLAVIMRFVYFGGDPQAIHFTVVRTTYALACLVYWYKAFHIFYVTQELGPKVITLFKMMNDLMFFLMLYLVLLISFSIPIYVLIYPHRDSDNSFVQDVSKLFVIMYSRWWNLVGISMDESRDEAEGTNKNCQGESDSPGRVNSLTGRLVKQSAEQNSSAVSTAVMNNPGEHVASDSCPQFNPVAILLLVTFLIITNIMLLNMLIAMLTRTVDAVQGQALRLWRYHLYRIAHEFFGKSPLPSPLMVFEIIFSLVRCFPKNRKALPLSSDMKEYFSPDDFEYQKLSFFERSAAVHLVDAECGDDKEGKAAILSRLKIIHEKLYQKLDIVEAKISNIATLKP